MWRWTATTIASLIEAKNRELDRLEAIYRSLLANAGVELIEGRGIVTGLNNVRVGEQDLTQNEFLSPPAAGRRYPTRQVLQSMPLRRMKALDLAKRPDRVLVYGAGYIACEFASIFNGFSIGETHLVYRADLPLRGFDADIRAEAATALANRGIMLHPGCTVASVVSGQQDVKTVTLSDGSEIDADQVMAATGRLPNTAGLGLETAGIELGPKGEMAVDADSRTRASSIYAVGDVTDRVALTPVAIAEGTPFPTVSLVQSHDR